jgi:hypothetical protein
MPTLASEHNKRQGRVVRTPPCLAFSNRAQFSKLVASLHGFAGTLIEDVQIVADGLREIEERADRIRDAIV